MSAGCKYCFYINLKLNRFKYIVYATHENRLKYTVSKSITKDEEGISNKAMEGLEENKAINGLEI